MPMSGDELVNLVRSGHYKKVSASFLLPGHPSNPSKTSLHLKHIGFLGATPPGVKGLEQFEFAEFGQSCQLPDCLPPHLARGFSVPAGYTADPIGLKLLELVHEFATACPELSFSESFNLATTALRT